MTAKILTLYFNILRKMVLLTQQFSDNDINCQQKEIRRVYILSSAHPSKDVR